MDQPTTLQLIVTIIFIFVIILIILNAFSTRTSTLPYVIMGNGVKKIPFTVSLNTNTSLFPLQTLPTGVGRASLNPTLSVLEYDIVVQGLPGPVNGGFYIDTRNQKGLLVKTLIPQPILSKDNTIIGWRSSGIWTQTDTEPLTESLIKELTGGHIYINLVSPYTSTSEISSNVIKIRGQLIPSYVN